MALVTIKDIARHAGVTHSTVSRALRDNPLVAPATTLRIKRIASELGYVPSATARTLKTRESRVLGVIVNHISDPFYSEVLDGIQDVLFSAGYSLFLAATDHNPDREKAVIRAMTERRVDGLIVCSVFSTRRFLAQFTTSAAPVVVVHNRSNDTASYTIEHDDRFGGHEMTRHLIELGHTRLAFVGNGRAGREVEQRLKGFQEAMRAARLAVPTGYIVQAATGQLAAGSEAVRPLLDLAEPPTGLVCFNDMLAVGAIQTLRQAGKRVPDDCSVVGFDDIPLAALVTPALTTFDQPKYPLGEEAARTILRLLDAKSGQVANAKPGVITLRGKVRVRASSAPPPLRTDRRQD